MIKWKNEEKTVFTERRVGTDHNERKKQPHPYCPCWDILHKTLLASQNSLAYGDAIWAAGHRVDDADQTQAAGGEGGAGAEDAVVRGGLCIARGRGLRDVAAGRRGLCGRSVFDGEAARLGAPLLQREHHGEVLACRERRRRCCGEKQRGNTFSSCV